MEIPTGVRDWIFELWHEGALRPFSITGISGFAVDDAAPQLVRERYGTAVVGFDALVREARFELGLGAIYEACYRHHARLTAPPPSVPPAPDPPHFNELMSDFGMPIEVQAVLMGTRSTIPSRPRCSKTHTNCSRWAGCSAGGWRASSSMLRRFDCAQHSTN